MNHALAIARRELVEKRFVFVAPAAAAALILLLPAMPHVRSAIWQEIYVVGSAVFAVAFSVGLAAILGASIVGRELSENRLSFYFTKPVAAPAIWFGKLMAAALLIAGTFAIAMLPNLFVDRRVIHATWSGNGRALLVPLVVLIAVAFFLAHLLSTIARARSPWAVADLAAFGAAGVVLWWVLQPLLSHFALAMTSLLLEVFGWLLLAAIVSAGAWQLTRGRTDRLQSHLALSRFFWAAVAVALGVCGANVLWVVSAGLQDLRAPIIARLSPGGEYAFVTGGAVHRRDYRPLFMLDVATGEARRLSDGMPASGAPFSPDGSTVALFRPFGRGAATSAWLVDRIAVSGEIAILDVATGRETTTDLTVPAYSMVLLAPGGQRIVHQDRENVVSIYDVARKRSLGSFRLPGPAHLLWFASPDLLRIYAISREGGKDSPRLLQIFEYDLRAHSLVKTGQYRQSGKYMLVSASADGTRLFVRNGPDSAAVLEARSGAVLMTIDGIHTFTSLDGGGMAGIGSAQLRIFDASGTPQRDIALDPGVRWLVARAIAHGPLLVLGRTETSVKIVTVDPQSGKVVREQEGLTPMFVDQPVSYRQTPLNPEQLVVDGDGSLLRWNAITGERKVLIAEKGK